MIADGPREKKIMNFNRMPLHPQFPSPSHLPPNAGPPAMPPNPGHMPQGMPPGPLPPHLPPQHMGGPDLGRGDGMSMPGHFSNQVSSSICRGYNGLMLNMEFISQDR